MTSLDKQLIEASTTGKVNEVRLLIENKANIHALDDETLRLASRYGHTEIVKI